jgi:orotate phosphoribosyltransferase
VLFGPAYKGIPLVSAIAIALATETQARCPLPPFLSPALGAAVAAES